MPGPELPPRAGGLGALCRPRGAGGRAAAAAARARPAGHPASRPAGAALALSLRLHLRQLRRPAAPAARRNLLHPLLDSLHSGHAGTAAARPANTTPALARARHLLLRSANLHRPPPRERKKGVESTRG